MSKVFKDLMERYDKKENYEMGEEDWEKMEEINSKNPNMTDEQSVIMFETFFCTVEDLEEAEEEYED